MGMRPSADVFFGFVISQDDQGELANLDSDEIEAMSTDKVELFRAGWEFQDVVVCIPGTYNRCYDWGEHRLDKIRDVTPIEVCLFMAEVEGIGIEAAEPGWKASINYE